MLKSVCNFIKNNDFSLNLFDKHIYINNFKDVLVLEPNKVVISYLYGKIIIKGNDLLVNKLCDNEILLSGIFTSLEFDYNV